MKICLKILEELTIIRRGTESYKILEVLNSKYKKVTADLATVTFFVRFLVIHLFFLCQNLQLLHLL